MYITQLSVSGQLSFPEVTEGMGGGSEANRTGIAGDSSSGPSPHSWGLTPACSCSSGGSDDQSVICPMATLIQVHIPLPTICNINVKQTSSESDGRNWRVGLVKNDRGPGFGSPASGGSLPPVTLAPEGSIHVL